MYNYSSLCALTHKAVAPSILIKLSPRFLIILPRGAIDLSPLRLGECYSRDISICIDKLNANESKPIGPG